MSCEKQSNETFKYYCYFSNDMVNNLTIIKSLEPFLTKPKEQLHLSGIAREIKLPHPTVRLWLNELEQLGILKKNFKGRLTLYNLHKEHPLIKEYLTLAEKEKLIDKCKYDLLLREVVLLMNSVLLEQTKAILFGSATETTKNANDIDILLVGKHQQINRAEWSRKLNKTVHIINVKSMEKVTKALKEEIIKKHLIIQGTEEVVTWMLKD